MSGPSSLLKTGIIAMAVLSLVSPPTASAQHEQGGHESTSGHHDSRGGVGHWLPRLEDPDRDEWQRPAHVVALLEISDGMRVVDLGAGTGYFLGHLAKAVGGSGSVLGLDVEQSLVDYMNERAETESWSNVNARVIATDDPGLPPQSVDRILIVNTWHHIDNREVYAGRLASALKPGGAIYIVDLTMDNPHGPPPNHRLSSDAVQAELTAGGLETRVVEEGLPYQYVVVARN